MKAATCAFAASLLAATTAALATNTTSAADAAFSSSAVSGRSSPGFCPGVLREGNPSNLNGKDCVISLLEKEKFAPRFDGLRFIETLVTAHR